MERTNKMLMKTAVVLCFTAVGVGIFMAGSAWSNSNEADIGNTTGDSSTGIEADYGSQGGGGIEEKMGNETGDANTNESNPGSDEAEGIEEAEPLSTRDAAPSGGSCGGRCGSPTCGAARGGSCGCGR